MSIADQLRAMTPAEALRRAGAKPHRRPGRWAPCPVCGSDSGGVLVGEHVWTCYACKTSADAATTACLLSIGRPVAGREGWPDVCAWVIDRGWATPDDAPAPVRVATVEVRGTLAPLPDPDPMHTEVWGYADAIALAVAVRAVAAGLPEDYALDAARTWLDARAAEVADGHAVADAIAALTGSEEVAAVIRHRRTRDTGSVLTVSIDVARAALGRGWRDTTTHTQRAPADV